MPSEPGGARSLLQAGVELYGPMGLESDAEILALMLKTLQLAGLKDIHVDIGHTGILQGLIDPLTLGPDQKNRVFYCLQRKATDELSRILADWSIDSDHARALLKLVDMEGDVTILDEIRTALKPCGEQVCSYVDDLKKIAELTTRQVRNAPLYFDVTEFRAYHYHTGMTFVAYVPGESQGVAFGGRYDEIGQAFGPSRPATGFSTDVKKLFQLTPRSYKRKKGIYAPSSEIPGLYDLIGKLRQQGEIVICDLPGQPGSPAELGCDREIRLERGKWEVRDI